MDGIIEVVEVEIIRRHVKVLIHAGKFIVVVGVVVFRRSLGACDAFTNAPTSPRGLNPHGGAVEYDVRGAGGRQLLLDTFLLRGCCDTRRLLFRGPTFPLARFIPRRYSTTEVFALSRPPTPPSRL